MATINLTVVAESAEELKSILIDLANIVDATEAVVATSEGAAAVAISNNLSTSAPAAESEKKRGRGRPRLTAEQVAERDAKIEAEKAAEKAAPLDPPTPAEMKDAAPVAKAAPLPPTEPPVNDAPAPKVTIEEVRTALKLLVDAKGRDAAMGIIRAQGYEKLSDVAEQMYGEIIVKAKAACA
jgi:hypothetical protein